MCFGFQLSSLVFQLCCLVFVGMIYISYLRLEWFPISAKQPCNTQIFAVLYRQEM